MSKVTIENPVINSPFEEPQRHFIFTDRGITEDITEGRRRSEYFIPMPKPKKTVTGRANDTASRRGTSGGECVYQQSARPSDSMAE